MQINQSTRAFAVEESSDKGEADHLFSRAEKISEQPDTPEDHQPALQDHASAGVDGGVEEIVEYDAQCAGAICEAR